MGEKNESFDISLKARAKINLNLDIVGRREDGYHLLEMIMQQINLYDIVNLKKIENGIILKTSCSYIKDDESNIAYKAAYLMMNLFTSIKGVSIEIKKNIPVAAGLAGGSADAAAVITGLNILYNLNLSQRKMMEIGLKIGSDIPFCIMGGCAIAKGIGEILEPLNGIRDKWVLISKPEISVSTQKMYLKFDVNDIRKKRPFNELVEAVNSQDLKTIGKLMYNSLEKVTISNYGIVENLKLKINETKPIFSMMSGSGPTVFGVYKNYEKGLKAFKKLSKIYDQTYLVKTYNNIL